MLLATAPMVLLFEIIGFCRRYVEVPRGNHVSAGLGIKITLSAKLEVGWPSAALQEVEADRRFGSSEGNSMLG